MDLNSANLDISRLSDADKRDLQQQISNEMQKAKLQDYTCWTKCITGGISGGKLSSKEETCTQNCVERFLDANTAVLKHLEQMRGEIA
ncbi:MAG: hypothetical protein LQ350_005770 [Teloschistes chrysophthalmus]|nr:MAG: hypothetical protein LQ350_005770 [Niorma chrysophthalma]